MAHSSNQKCLDAWRNEVRGIPLQAANDNSIGSAPQLLAVLTPAILAWLVTLVVGGIALSKAIIVVAVVFRTPAFAELQGMGFVMAGVLGMGVAGALVIDGFRDPQI